MFDPKQNSASPLITIAMPVYNGGKYLDLAVRSLMEQTFSNWELLIVDDGSTDGATDEISVINDPRIHILRDGKNKGLAERLNECIDLARGQYLARMDHDDVSYPDRFMQQLMFFEQNPELDVVAVRAITIDENDRAIGSFPSSITHTEICAKPWLGFYFPHPTWMGKIEWFRRYRYTIPGPYFCEDQELLLRSYQNSKFGTLDKILFAYRVRGEVNWGKLAKTRRTIFSAQLRHFAKSKHWHFVFPAIAMYFAKRAVDILRKFGNTACKPANGALDNTSTSEWEVVIKSLQRKR